jgi:hypothetical protein
VTDAGVRERSFAVVVPRALPGDRALPGAEAPVREVFGAMFDCMSEFFWLALRLDLYLAIGLPSYDSNSTSAS